MNLSKKDMIRKSPGDQCTREIARRAGVDDRGRPTPAGSEVVSAGAILAVAKAGVFSKWQFAFEFARRWLNGGQKNDPSGDFSSARREKAKRLSAYRDIGTRIGGSNWLNTEYPGFAVGDDPGAPIVIGASFAFGAVAAAGFAGTLSAGLESVADGGAAVVAGCLEHAAENPRSIAMTKSFVIGGLLF
jgi:hypothetical protein